MLVEETMFGIRDKVKIAIDRIKTFEPPEGYYLAFSGGKDSQCVYHLTKEAGVKFEAHFYLTTVDPPELLKFVKLNYPEVIRDRPPMTMWELIVKHKYPPTRIARYCCETLKERGGAGRVVITGIRKSESVKRSKRRMTEVCMKDKTKTYLHPIIDWSVDEVWEYLNSRNIPHCCLYDEGQKRIGCIGCPMQGGKGMKIDFERWPSYKAKYIKAFEKIVKVDDIDIWRTAESIMEWWLHDNKGIKVYDEQASLFEDSEGEE